MDAHLSRQIEALQEVAARRYDWARKDRDEYVLLGGFPTPLPALRAQCVDQFVKWTGERAEYARTAMKLMGITEDDQIN